jgi:hypothetical protein
MERKGNNDTNKTTQAINYPASCIVVISELNQLGGLVIKSLALSGVKQFASFDSAKVTKEDVGLIYTLQDIGKSRQKCLVKSLEDIGKNIKISRQVKVFPDIMFGSGRESDFYYDENPALMIPRVRIFSYDGFISVGSKKVKGEKQVDCKRLTFGQSVVLSVFVCNHILSFINSGFKQFPVMKKVLEADYAIEL